MRTILILAANPKMTNHLRLDEEVRNIEQGIERAKSRDQFKVVVKWAVTDDDLRRAVLDNEPEIVHFAGHGTEGNYGPLGQSINPSSNIDSGGLVFEDNVGSAQLISGNALAELFELCSDSLECVVLNACYSESQAEAISNHIDIVIGMSKAIGDQAAIKFATGFYDALGAGQDYEKAFKFGCSAINLKGIPEQLTPILKKSKNSLSSNPRTPAIGIGDLETSPPPNGGLPPDDCSYVIRPTDKSFASAIKRRDGVIRICGARQVGKTSLLGRGIQEALRCGMRVIYTDFQAIDRSDLKSIVAFYMALGAKASEDLGLDVYLKEVWDDRKGPNANFAAFVIEHLIYQSERPVFWAMDEVDRLFTCDFGSDVFALFRSWHNARALNPDGPWSRFTLTIAYATEAHLFIKDLSQSPFNVGTEISLNDFSESNTIELNALRGSPLTNAKDLRRFHQLVGGHPFLANRGLYEMKELGLDLLSFENEAEADDGLFGDHLRRILIAIEKDSELLRAVSDVLRGRACPSSDAFYRLRSSGVFAGGTPQTARMRCSLYSTYLQRHTT